MPDGRFRAVLGRFLAVLTGRQGTSQSYVHPAAVSASTHATVTVLGKRSIPLTESISVTNVTESDQAQLSLNVEYAVRVTDTNTQRFTFTISQKIPGTTVMVPLLTEVQVINEGFTQLRAALREQAEEAEGSELGKRLQELADEC